MRDKMKCLTSTSTNWISMRQYSKTQPMRCNIFIFWHFSLLLLLVVVHCVNCLYTPYRCFYNTYIIHTQHSWYCRCGFRKWREQQRKLNRDNGACTIARCKWKITEINIENCTNERTMCVIWNCAVNRKIDFWHNYKWIAVLCALGAQPAANTDRMWCMYVCCVCVNNGCWSGACCCFLGQYSEK